MDAKVSKEQGWIETPFAGVSVTHQRVATGDFIEIRARYVAYAVESIPISSTWSQGVPEAVAQATANVIKYAREHAGDLK